MKIYLESNNFELPNIDVYEEVKEEYVKEKFIEHPYDKDLYLAIRENGYIGVTHKNNIDFYIKTCEEIGELEFKVLVKETREYYIDCFDTLTDLTNYLESYGIEFDLLSLKNKHLTIIGNKNDKNSD